MQLRDFGNTGMKVSPLGFGAAEIGFEGVDEATVERILAAAIEAGVNVVDTAAVYKDSEDKIGRALAGRRDEVLLFTKCGSAFKANAPDEWTPEKLMADIETSLRKLNTDVLDLVQLHSCTMKVFDAQPVIETLQRAKEQGKTRFIGYSGDNAELGHAVASGAFDAIQCSINVADQINLAEHVPAAHAAGMGVIAKRPIANVIWRHESPPDGHIKPYHTRLQTLGYDLVQKPLTDGIATALRFTLSIPGVSTAIVGTGKPNRFSDNAHIVDMGPLPDDQLQAMRDRWTAVADDTWIGKT